MTNFWWQLLIASTVAVWLIGVVIGARVTMRQEGQVLEGDDWIPLVLWPVIGLLAIATAPFVVVGVCLRAAFLFITVPKAQRKDVVFWKWF